MNDYEALSTRTHGPLIRLLVSRRLDLPKVRNVVTGTGLEVLGTLCIPSRAEIELYRRDYRVALLR